MCCCSHDDHTWAEHDGGLQAEVIAFQEECAKELSAAEPIIQQAEAALNSLDKASLGELKSFGSPAAEVVQVVSACMVLTAPGGKIPKVSTQLPVPHLYRERDINFMQMCLAGCMTHKCAHSEVRAYSRCWWLDGAAAPAHQVLSGPVCLMAPVNVFCSNPLCLQQTYSLFCRKNCLQVHDACTASPERAYDSGLDACLPAHVHWTGPELECRKEVHG